LFLILPVRHILHRHTCLYRFFLLLISLALSSCATVHYPLQADQLKAYVARDGQDPLIERYAPIYIIEEDSKDHNRIGTPSVRIDDDDQIFYINPDRPAVYYCKQSFRTEKGFYTNLIYRVHFEKVPFSIVPFYLNTGRNVGLIFIVTLNEADEPVLLTTVHTCGCYLFFIPTSYTPNAAYPIDWQKEKWQWVFGEYLPARLDYDASALPALHPTLLIRSNTHRVKALWLDIPESIAGSYEKIPARLLPMDTLDQLSVNGDETSFFESTGARKGYVKDSHKPLERLLMSWWTLDWRIGEDKMYDPVEGCDNKFYTSVKFWARKESDMCYFPQFLKYWNWNF